MTEFQKIVQAAKKLKVERVNKETGNLGDLYEVAWFKDKYLVRIFNKKGRKLMTCSCSNSSRFVNSPTVCVHKIAALLFESNYILSQLLEDLIVEYESYAANSLSTNPHAIVEDLTKLRRCLNGSD